MSSQESNGLGVDSPSTTSALHDRLLRFRHLLVEADYFSSVNKYLPWRYPLGSLFMAALAALLCGWFIHVQAFVILIGVGSMIVLGLVWPWLSLLGIRGQLSFERSRTVEGQGILARLTLRNYLPFGAWGLRLYGGDCNTLGVQSVINLAAVAAWRTTDYEFLFVPPMRGEYPKGKAALGTGFPFGLWEARRTIETEGTLIAWPKTFEAGAIPEAAGSDRTREGLVFQNRAGHGGDFLGVRPYIRGDSLRRIHWAQSARHDSLIVCERQASANISLQILLDVDPNNHVGQVPSSSREWAIRIAASMIEEFLGRGALVELQAGDARVGIGGGPTQRNRLLDTLARIPERSNLGLADCLGSATFRGFRSGLQTVITTDLGLLALPPELRTGRRSRLILLHTSAFNARTRKMNIQALGVRPWVEIQNAQDIPAAFRKAWREVA